MKNTVEFEIKLSQQSVIKRVKSLTGNLDFVIAAPFSGWVNDDKFRINKNTFIVHPFVPVAKGNVKSTDGGAEIKLNFVFPWLGHASMIAIIIMYISIPFAFSWGVVIAILCIWVFFTASYTHERQKFVRTLKDFLQT